MSDFKWPDDVPLEEPPCPTFTAGELLHAQDQVTCASWVRWARVKLGSLCYQQELDIEEIDKLRSQLIKAKLEVTKHEDAIRGLEAHSKLRAEKQVQTLDLGTRVRFNSREGVVEQVVLKQNCTVKGEPVVTVCYVIGYWGYHQYKHVKLTQNQFEVLDDHLPHPLEHTAHDA